MKPDEVIDLHAKLETAFADRDLEIRLNREFVGGNQWSTGDLADLPEGVEPVTMNYMYPIVLKNVTFLVGRPPEVSVPLAEDTPEARSYASFLEKVVYGLWDWNRVTRRLSDWAWNCSVAGGQPVIYDWDPRHRRVVWTSPLPERFYPSYAREGDPLSLDAGIVVEYYSAEYIARWLGVDVASVETDYTAGGLEYVTVLRYIDSDEHLWVQKSTGTLIDRRKGNGWVNAVYLPNVTVAGGFDGLADATALRALQRELNQMMTTQRSVAEYYSDPITVLEGTGVDPDRVGWGPGLKLPILAGGKAYFLSWEGTPPDFREHVTAILSAMQDLSGIPDVSFGRYTASIQSGIALNTQFQPVRLQMSVKQTAWDDAFNQLHRGSLELLNKKMGTRPVEMFGRIGTGQTPFALTINPGDLEGYSRTKLIWPGMLPKDDTAEAQTLLNQLQANGISLRTYLEKMGVESPDEEIKRLREELQDPVLHPENVVQGEGGEVAPSPFDALAGGGMPMGGGDSMGMAAGLGMAQGNQSPEQAYAMRGGPDMGV